MADQEQTSTAADPGAAEDSGSSSDRESDERLTRVEHDIADIKQAIASLVPGSHAEAEQRTERRLDRGSAVAEQVRAELAKAKQEETAAAAAEGEQSERRQVQERLARLEERPPAPPRMRRTAMLGWGDGRS